MLRKSLQTLWTVVLLVMCCSVAFAESSAEDIKIKQIIIESIPQYVVCSSDGKWLHDPVAFPIIGAFERDENDDYVIFALEGDEEGWLAIYHEKTGWFSGFIFKEMFGYSEGLAVVSIG